MMGSDSEFRAADVASEDETHFIPRSDDEDVLWEVQEITAERGKKYKVKWAGSDPTTGKPWGQSWVAKHDVTDDLVVDWKAKKKRRTEWKRRGRGGRASTSLRGSGSSKRAESSTTASARKSRLSTSEATASRLYSVEEHVSPLLTRSKRQQEPDTPLTASSSVRKSRRRRNSYQKIATEKELERWNPPPPDTSSDEDDPLDASMDHVSPLPGPSTTKRKRDSETPASAGQADEESQASRPPKKQKMALETSLLPPITDSDEEEEELLPRPGARANTALQKRVRRKSAVESSEEDISPLKAKGKSVRSAVNSTASDSRDESKRGSKSKAKVVLQRKEHAADVNPKPATSEEDEEPPLPKSKQKLQSKGPSSSNQGDDDKEVASLALPMKIGPPRGVKRQGASNPPRKPASSRSKPKEDDSIVERALTDGSKGRPGNGASDFDKPASLRESTIGSSTSIAPPEHISIPPPPSNIRPRSPELSPGSRARLELFDRMMTDPPRLDHVPPPADVLEQIPDDPHLNYNEVLGTFDTHDTYDAPASPLSLSPLPSKSKAQRPKPDTSNGLIVPETESSGNSQGQSQLLLKVPPSPQPPPVRETPRKPIDLPAIAVIGASARSSASPQGLFPIPQRRPLPQNRPFKRPAVKPVPQMTPNTFRTVIKAHSQVADSEPPLSSIESFASPQRVDKGKQKAVEEGPPRSDVSEEAEDAIRRKIATQKIVTDSGLEKRGKALFDQMLLTREAERQKTRKPKRLKPVHDIVNRAGPSPSMGSPLPSTIGAEDTAELRLEDVIDLTGGANSTTMDTMEQSERKTPSEEERERRRIELRQEEEENSQEAMGIYPSPPVHGSDGVNGGDVQMLPPRSPERSVLSGPIEDVDQTDQPAELQHASVIVHPSQGQRQEDADVEVLPTNLPVSSPARPIPENLTDSPKRRLGEALSLLNVKSEEIQRLERELADARKNTERLETEVTKLQQSPVPTGPVLAAWEAERVQWNQERSKWENEIAMWETQRKAWVEEKASLSVRVAELVDATTRAEEVRIKLSGLEVERDAWIREREVLRDSTTQCTEELAVLAKARGEAEQGRVEWEAERASWAEEKGRWETERAALQEQQEIASRSISELTASVESLTSAKVSADKDRDFFREQYAQASAFVGSVRDENVELEKRVKIAEGQAREGVALVKALYEGHIKSLQADVGRWKGLTELLQEKDRRTNDELRLQAAQAPELRDLCNRLTAENESLEVDVRKLSAAQQRSVVQRNKLYYEIIMLKKERASLRSRLLKSAKTADGTSTQDTTHSAPASAPAPAPAPSPAPPILQDSDSFDPNDVDIVPDPASRSLDESFEELGLYPCMWRPEWRDQCQHAFDSKEDLERHVQDHYRALMSA